MTADPTEYKERLGRVRERMTQSDLGALVVCDPANLFYLTGYNPGPSTRRNVSLVPAEGELHLFSRAQDRQARATRATCPPSRSTATRDLVHRPDVHPFDWIATAARELGARR